MITCVPEIKKVPLTPEDKYVVIACDGIWDCLTSQECGELLAKSVKTRKSTEKSFKVVEDMFDQIICKDVHAPDCDGSGTDNMTCILIEVKNK